MATEKRNSQSVYTFNINETPCNSKHNNTHKASVRRFSSVLLLPIVTLVMLFTTACQEDEGATNYLRPMTDVCETTYDDSLAWNPNNPYDSVGYWHNNLLDYYINNGGSIFRSYNIDSISNYVFSVVRHYQNNMFGFTNTTILNTYTLFIYTVPDNYDTFDDYLVSLGYSQACIDLFNDIMISAKDTSIVSASSLCNVVKNKENEIATKPISLSEKQSLYAFCATLKFSALYWDEIGSNHDNGWQDKWNNTGDDRPINAVGWKTKAAADAAGALVGAAGGFWSAIITAYAATLAVVEFNEELNALYRSTHPGYTGDYYNWP